MLSLDNVAEYFVAAADTLVDDFDLIDFLHGLTVATAEITEAEAVGLLLTDVRGQLNHLAASSEDLRAVEHFQLVNQEGPCLDSFLAGEQVIEQDLATASARWPRFAPRAAEAGFLSVHAFPMRLRDKVIGALNVFGATAGPLLPPDGVATVQAMADVATIAIMQERALLRADLLTEQLEFALNSRLVLEQAKGAVARAGGIGVEAAADLLRRRARATGVGLTTLAHEVVTTPGSLTALVAFA